MSSVFVPGLGDVFIPVKPCGGKQWNDGVLAVDWPPIGGFPFLETPAGMAPDGQGGVFLLATPRQNWLSRTGGSYTLRHISAAGAVSAAHDFLPPGTDVGVLGPIPQAAVVPSGPGRCIVIWGWHQGLTSLRAQSFDTQLRSRWGIHPRIFSHEVYPGSSPANFAAEPDGDGGAVAAWWTTDLPGIFPPSSAARAGWLRKNGTVGWLTTFLPSPLPTLPWSWLQVVPGVSAGEAIVVAPETSASGITYNAYAFDASGTSSPPVALAGSIFDAEISYLRTRAAVTDGKGGLFLGYVDSSASLHVLRFQPPSNVAWDESLGPIVNLRAFRVTEDSSGGVLVSWVSPATPASPIPRVELRRLSASGTATWDINAGSTLSSLEVFLRPSSIYWQPDEWAGLAQAVPDGSGGAILVYQNFPIRSQAAKLFTVCIDETGAQQGNVEEVSSRSGPQRFPLVTATADDSSVVAWSDEGPGISGSQVWANLAGCCPPTGLPFPAPIPCGFPDGLGPDPGSGDFGFFLPCGDDGEQYGLMPLMQLTKWGVDLPGCVANRASPAPDWIRLTFRGLPRGTSIELRSGKGKVLARSRTSPFGLSLTFAPVAGPRDQLLVFRHRGRRGTKPLPARVEGSWGDGKPPAIVVRQARVADARRRKRRRSPRAKK